jgi:hypothetical protein
MEESQIAKNMYLESNLSSEYSAHGGTLEDRSFCVGRDEKFAAMIHGGVGLRWGRILSSRFKN